MLKMLLQDVKDRLAGNKAKANARLAMVNAPEGSGKLIWLVADHSYDSVVMAAALLAAIREKRKDVRLVLTYQTEYQDVLVRHFNGLNKIGFGYGVGDNKLAAKQMVKRLSPFAVIFVGHQPDNAILNVLAEKTDIHKIAFQFVPDNEPSASFYEACYPGSHSQNKAPLSQAAYISPVFDVLTRLVQSQIDKQLGAMLCGNAFDELFHVHNVPPEQIKKMINKWQENTLSKNALLAFSFSPFVSEKTDGKIEADKEKITAACDAIESAGYQPVLLSQWQQLALSQNDVVIADEQKWVAALFTASAATHLADASQLDFWQAASSGAALSYSATTTESDDFVPPAFNDVIQPVKNTHDLAQDLYCYWSDLVSSPMKQRKASDVIRKIFWTERRKAETQVNELLQRVYDW